MYRGLKDVKGGHSYIQTGSFMASLENMNVYLLLIYYIYLYQATLRDATQNIIIKYVVFPV